MILAQEKDQEDEDKQHRHIYSNKKTGSKARFFYILIPRISENAAL